MTERKAPPMVLNADGVTYRFPGAMQFPRTQEEQKKVGLIAIRNVSIHGREAKGGR